MPDKGNFGAVIEVAHCLRGRPNKSNRADSDTYVAQPIPYDLFQITAPVNRQNRAPGDPRHTLARDNAAYAAVVQQGVDLYNHAMTGDVAATVTEACGGTNTSGPKVVGFVPKAPASSRSIGAEEEMSPTVTAHCMAQAVAFSCKDHGADASAISPTLRAMGHGASHANGGGQAAAAILSGRMPIVRRLTPRECERLQGFPDDWTLIPWRGKPPEQCPDGPRYKACGNSMAANCMAWIGRRLDAVDKGTPLP